MFRKFSAGYLAKCPRVDATLLQNWTPARSFYAQLRKWIGLLPGMAIRSAVVDGHAIRYWDFGARRRSAVVLLHGFSASKENWINILHLLGRSYRVLVPDIPGFGESSFHPGSDYSVEAQGRRMDEWFSALGLKDAHWVGSSMGGAIAGVVAALEPRAVRSLTLMSAAGVAGRQSTAFEWGLGEGVNGLIAEDRAQMARVFRLITGGGGGVRLQNAFLSRLIARDQIARAPVYHQLFQEMMTPGPHPSAYWACAVEAPTLILWGDRDKVLHPCETEVFQALIPGSEVIVLRGVGHLPMMEAPFRTAKTLRAFWRRAGSAI